MFRLLLATAALLGALRLVDLGGYPPGFWVDEATEATHVMCLLESGADFYGQRWPLFSASLAGGQHTAPFLYPCAGWVAIAGSSPWAFRCFTVLSSLLAIFGLFLLAKSLSGNLTAAWTALAAVVSPWSIALSRLAWDPAIIPCLTVWGFYLLLGRRGRWSAAAAGAVLAVSLYGYPSSRVLVPLVMLGVLMLRRHFETVTRERLLVAALVALVVAAPLLQLVLDGRLLGRAEYLSVLSSSPRNPSAGRSTLHAAGQVLLNFARHLSPEFLLLRGDANPRHSVGLTGVLSWLDVLAFLGGLVLAAIAWRSGERVLHPGSRRTLVLAAIGLAAGILPAALTWQGIPHALRAIGAWPFVSLGAGVLMAEVTRRWPRLVGVALGVTVLWCAFFVSVYVGAVGSYPARAAVAFHAPVRAAAEEAAETGDWSRFDRLTRSLAYRPVAAAYFKMHYGGVPCRVLRPAPDGRPGVDADRTTR